MKTVLGVVGIFLTVSCGDAMTPQEYLRMRQKDSEHKAVAQVYVSGMVNGLEWANTAMQQTYGRSLYCPPDTLSMTADTYLHMLDTALVQKKDSTFVKTYHDKNVLGLILLGKLQEIFPCGKQ